LLRQPYDVVQRFTRVCLLWTLVVSAIAHADQPCRTVEITFKPVKELQIAVWIEDDKGNYVATAYVTRLTATFGLGNRPGNHFLHSATRFPYGRRDMVLPIWAHKRNRQYRFVVMGGLLGNSMASCRPPASPGDCDDDTVAYHSAVSSMEPFYCSPNGGQISTINTMDAVSCASVFTGSKGAYATDGRFSLYPPRADLTQFDPNRDSDDARHFAGDNDLGAISGATPQTETLLNPPIHWTPFADGKYVVKIEVSQEGDPPVHQISIDSQPQWNNVGTTFIGQPSVVYAVPITVGPQADEQIATAYEGYSDWDGSTGVEHAPDSSMTDMPGKGAGRLLDVTDNGRTFRVRVRSAPTCGTGTGNCAPPNPPTNLQVTSGATSVDLSFASANYGPPTNRFDVRYRVMPISDGDFTQASPPSQVPPAPGLPGSTVNTSITGLRPTTQYYVAVRAYSACDAPSSVVTASATTGLQKFAVLHGCFIATAAYGTPMAAEIDALRAVRDRALLTNPLGRLAVASYYALSPPLANAIASDERLRAGARRLLRPVVDLARAVARFL
jgi:hypothetical protein